MYHISKIFNQEIILNFFYAINKDWSLQDTINLVSLVISVIATIVIPIVIFKLNTENQQLQALYQKKYEFWLEFSKSFFIMQNTLSFLLQPGNLKYGIVYQCSKKEVINNLQKFIDRWDKFYDLVDGNQKIYLESTGINVLILQTLISAIANLIKGDTLEIIETNGFSTITSGGMNQLVSEAKLFFENNVKRLGNNQLEQNYINALNYYIRKNKISSIPEIDAKLTYEEKLKIIDEISNSAYLEIVYSNFRDISEKILNIVNPAKTNIFCKIKIIRICQWFWENIVQKIFSVKNKDSHKILTILWIKIKFKRSV